MNNIDEMPAKCKSCPYWEACEYPGICQDIEPKPAENGHLNAESAENLQNRPTDGDLISRQAAIDALNEQIEQCNKALGSFDISLKDEFAIKVERASLKAYKEQLENLPTVQPERPKADADPIKALPPAPAIPLAWIESYIKTCEIFDLRANVPAEKIIKTMVKIWRQENPGGKKGGDNGKT